MKHFERLKSLLRSHRQRQGVLFVGAGFSAEAEGHDLDGNVQKLLSARDFARFLAEKLDEDESDLKALSSIYEDKFGEHQLYSLLKSFFVVNKVTDSQRAVARFPWKQIYTTNYDNVIDTCLSSDGINHSIHTTSQKPSDIDSKILPVVHINGYIQSATFKNYKKEIKLTDVQYFSEDFSRSAWGERFRTDLIMAPVIVFAGYSLYDIDVARVINSFEGMNDRIFFVVKENPSGVLVKKLEGFGRVLPIGLDAFAKAIEQILSEPEMVTAKEPIAWERIHTPNMPSRPLRDVDVSNYLMSGSVDSSLLAADIIRNENNLFINRDVCDYITCGIAEKRFKNTLLSSNVGNGKTEALLAIGYKLAARGFTVYRASSRPSLLLQELSLIRDKNGPVALIIDDIFSYIDVIDGIYSISRDDIYTISSSRTAQVDLQEGHIRKVFKESLEVFNLDTLSDSETENVIRFFDRYALWGPRQPQSFDQKKAFIQRDCSGELRFLILEAMNSPNIRTRIQEIMNVQGTPSERDSVRTVLIISQLLVLAQIESDLSTISEIAGFDARKAIAGHSSSLKDFTLLKNSRISIKSPIFSEYVIKKLMDTGFVINTMINSMRQLDELYDNAPEYAMIYKNFSRFIFVEQAISEEKRLVHMVHYFENIKELSHSREQSLFWLQYAMCRMSLSQWGEAKRLFDVSYAFSRASGYRDNRHLNNQWARFLLVSRTKSNEYTDFSQAFNEAHNICIKQMIDEPTSTAPYRVASNYLAFLERRKSDLSTGDLVGIIRSASEVSKRYHSAGKNIRHSVVSRCANDMIKTIEIAKARLVELGVTL